MFAELAGLATKFAPQIFSAASSLFGQSKADSRQEDAQNFSAQQYATRYQTTVNDLKQAGLSPMLAYGQGPGTAPTSSAASAPAPGDLGQVTMQSRLNAAQIANLQADTTNKEATAENIRADTAFKQAQTGASTASADQARANISYLEAQARSISESLKNIPKEGNRLDALVRNLSEEFKVLEHKVGTQAHAKSQMEWLAAKTLYEAGLTKIDLQAAENTGNLGAYSRESKVVLDILRSLIRK